MMVLNKLPIAALNVNCNSCPLLINIDNLWKKHSCPNPVGHIQHQLYRLTAVNGPAMQTTCQYFVLWKLMETASGCLHMPESPRLTQVR